MTTPSNLVIRMRRKTTVCFDGKNRCYCGELVGDWRFQWTAWAVLESMRFLKPDTDPQARLKFWRELNDYAVEARGDSAKCEFELVEVELEEAV